MAVTEARNVTISQGANVIGCMTSGSLSINSNTSNTPFCRGSGSLFGSSSLDSLSWEISFDGQMDPDETYGYEDIVTAIIAGNVVALTFDLPGVGNKSYSGSAYGSITLTAGESGNATYSVTFVGNSDLSEVVNV